MYFRISFLVFCRIQYFLITVTYVSENLLFVIIFQCLEIVEKSCKCGLHSKEVQCYKLYTCETKCKRMKDCNKHPCNKKVCNVLRELFSLPYF
jgi:hypothetical protein